MDARQLQAGLDILGADAAHMALYARTPLRSQSAKIIQRRMPDDAAAAAQQLFAVLRALRVLRVLRDVAGQLRISTSLVSRRNKVPITRLINAMPIGYHRP